MKILIALTISILLFTSCMERKTIDPIKAFEYWSGSEPEKEIKVLNAKYWQSAHWTKEYELYLEIQANPKWVKEFVKQNKMKVRTSSDLSLPDDAPNWFKPRIGLKAYEPRGFNQGSIYLVDEKTGYIWFYEIQL